MTAPFSNQRLERLRTTMAGHIERHELPGLVMLLSRRGATHVEALGSHGFEGEAARRPMRRNTIFRIASMTKPVAAVAALILVEEGRLRLDDPVDRWLPELAGRRVLRAIDSPLSDTVPARRPISLRDLLTFRFGIGMLMARPGTYPIQQAMADAGLAAGPNPPALAADEWLRRLGELPLMYQPGSAWLYHTGSDVLGILVARASGQPFEAFLRERIFAPLGMHDTGFQIAVEQLPRLPPSYRRVANGDALALHDEPAHSRWAAPAFASGGGGLLSTVDDYHAFQRMLLGGGQYNGERILARPTVELMTTDQLTPAQRQGVGMFLGDDTGWGLGVGVALRRTHLYGTPGRFGWDGGIGTSSYVDPGEGVIGILMTQCLMESPAAPAAFIDFWNGAYQALGD
jgi:CubicO group peptidase (beta-lactamase class C family)